MGKTVVLAEKPSVGKEIARVLGCKNAGGGYMAGGQYIVTWALGHLVTLEDPEYYGKQYKEWNLESLPMIPEKMALKIIPETAKQYHVVKKLLLEKDVTDIVIATDAGREGELVARWILEKAGVRKPCKRLWISSQTDKAIKEGFQRLKDGKQYQNLYQAAQARAEADWLVGLNVTRALTCRFNAQLSAGRVQTPTLAIIAAREKEIKRFVPKDYYHIKAYLNGFAVLYFDAKNQSAIFDKATAQSITAEITKSKTFCVTQVKITPKREPAPMLYDLTQLQRDANTLYQMSPKETLSAMQQLYERHKALTYPRTDSRYITQDIVPTLTDRLRAVSKGDFSPIVSRIIKERMTLNKECVNDKKVSDHHAIIPTEESANVLDMSGPEKRIYLLVVKRFLACFYPDYAYQQVKVELTCAKHLFGATGRVELKKGWREIYSAPKETDEEEQTLPQIKNKDVFQCSRVEMKALKTTPPPRYTEASLLSAMENPSKFIEDKNLKGFIDSGLGTPATRADIIEKLFSSFYVEKKGNSIYPTSKGLQLIGLVPAELKEPMLTAKWERDLEAIHVGSLSRMNFIKRIQGYAKELVSSVKTSKEIYNHDNITRTLCPTCGKPMLAVNGKKGKMLVCQDRQCGSRVNVSRTTNMRCPTCHKRMELVGEGEKSLYVCVCGFKEKASKMIDKIKSNSSASKEVVQSYMQKQRKEEKTEMSPIARALAEAMKKQNK